MAMSTSSVSRKRHREAKDRRTEPAAKSNEEHREPGVEVRDDFFIWLGRITFI
jgi:hypothetical protein